MTGIKENKSITGTRFCFVRKNELVKFVVGGFEIRTFSSGDTYPCFSATRDGQDRTYYLRLNREYTGRLKVGWNRRPSER
jgi:hypothetical protein